jgi:hypothetical protein
VRSNSGSAFKAASVLLLCLGAAACGSGVKGHTYAGPGGTVQISFQSDGKAYASMGPMTSNCTYTQSGNNITLICEGDTEQLTVQSDGSLNGPPDGMLAHLTKTK